jgi:hypothetical protein
MCDRTSLRSVFEAQVECRHAARVRDHASSYNARNQGALKPWTLRGPARRFFLEMVTSGTISAAISRPIARHRSRRAVFHTGSPGS